MRVSDCQSCPYCSRHTWSARYEPANYHAIGMTHAFAYCARYHARCSAVKKCEEKFTIKAVEALCQAKVRADSQESVTD